MSRILAVFGATGKQGGSIVKYVLNDPELSQKYKVRAITRNANSKKAKDLEKHGVEVVTGDVLDKASLQKALSGVHTVFEMTTPAVDPNNFDIGSNAFEIEYNSGKRIADIAVEQGVEYLIFSTLPSITEISGGKYTTVTPFDAKAKVEKYIRGLPIKSAFYCPGSFMENFQAQTFMDPRKTEDGTWTLTRNVSSKTQFPLIDAVGDSGKFVGAILADPEKYEGKTFRAATAMYDLDQIVAIISKATGKTIVYKQVSDEEWRASLPDMATVFVEYFRYKEEFGYFGPESENLVAWAAANARGRLSTFEEYLEAHPWKLE